MSSNTTEAAVSDTSAQPPELVQSASKRVSCDGAGGSLGHPRVYLEMGEKDFIDCPYCGKRFIHVTPHS